MPLLSKQYGTLKQEFVETKSTQSVMGFEPLIFALLLAFSKDHSARHINVRGSNKVRPHNFYVNKILQQYDKFEFSLIIQTFFYMPWQYQLVQPMGCRTGTH